MEAQTRTKSQERQARVKIERTRAKIARITDQNESALQASYALNEEERQKAAKLERRLEFGHTFTATYKKHGVQGVKDIFWNPNSKAYVSYNEKTIHVWSPDTEEQLYFCNFFEETKSHAISTIIYSKKNHMYFVISTDFKMHVFNEHLILIRQLPLKIRLIQFVHFMENQNKLITAGVDGCFMFQFDIEYRHPPKQNIILDPLGKMTKMRLSIIAKLPDCPAECKGLKWYDESQVLLLWSTQQLSIYTVPKNIVTAEVKPYKGETEGEFNLVKWFDFKNLMPPEDRCLDVLFHRKLLTFVTGSQLGNLTVWKCGNEINQIHQFDNCGKAVTSIQFHPREQHYFIAASLDSVIRVYDLRKYLHIYSFEIEQGLKYIRLVDSHLFACYFDDGLVKSGQLDNIAQLFLTRQQHVRAVGKMYKKELNKELNKPGMVYSLYMDNSIQFQKPREKNMEVISTIYPPPGATEILEIQHCTSRNEVFLLTEQGAVCIYKLDHITGTLLKVLKAGQIKDSKGMFMHQSICSMLITHIEPPSFDCNHNKIEDEKWNATKMRHGDEFEVISEDSFRTDFSLEFEDRWLGLGLSKGNVIFVQIPDYEVLYARFSIEKKESIQKMYHLPDSQLMLTISSINELRIWGFNKQCAEVYQVFDLYRPLKDIQMSNRIMLFGFESGDTELFMWDFTDASISADAIAHVKNPRDAPNKAFVEMNRQSALYKLPNQKLDGHEGGLGDIDYHPFLKLFVSGGPDATVKIFNLKKEIFKEIKFPQPVSSVVWMNQAGDLMISHNEKVSVVNYTELQMPKRSTYLTIPEMLKFVEKRQKATWKTFARLKLYEDSLKDKEVKDSEFAKLDEEEDFFNDDQKSYVVEFTSLQKRYRSSIKAIETVKSAIDLAELNVVLNKEKADKIKKFQEFKANKVRKEEIQQLPPEQAFDQMAEQIANEQIAIIQKGIDDKKVKNVKQRRRRVIEQVDVKYGETELNVTGVSKVASVASIKTPTDHKASQDTMPTAKRTDDSTSQVNANQQHANKGQAVMSSLDQKKLKEIHMQAKALRDSIAEGKQVMEQAELRQKELFPANTKTLPPSDYQGTINAFVDNSINFGYQSQPQTSIQATLSQSMHQISTMSRLNKKPICSRQDLTSLKIQENIRMYNQPNVNLAHNSIFITTNNDPIVMRSQISSASFQDPYRGSKRHVRSSTLSAMSDKSCQGAGNTIQQDYMSSKSSGFHAGAQRTRGIRQGRLRKSIQPGPKNSDAMVDTTSLNNLKDIAQDGSISHLVELDQLPPTQDGRENPDQTTTVDLRVSSMISNQPDEAHKRASERAISEGSQFRKKQAHNKLPSLPQQPQVEQIVRKNNSYYTKLSQNAAISGTNSYQAQTIEQALQTGHEYKDSNIPTLSQSTKKQHRLSRSIQGDQRIRPNKYETRTQTQSMAKITDLSRDNMIRNTAEMKYLRDSRDQSISSDKRDVPGHPELYVSNRFVQNSHVIGSQGGGIQISKISEGKKLQLRQKENQLRIKKEYGSVNNTNPGLRAYIDNDYEKNHHSMSTFQRLSQERLDTQEEKDLQVSIATNTIDKRNLLSQVHQESWRYNDKNTENLLSENAVKGQKLAQQKVVKLVSYSNDRQRESNIRIQNTDQRYMSRGDQFKKHNQDIGFTSPHEVNTINGSKPVYKQ